MSYLEFFKQISQIPRSSGGEEQISRFLADFGKNLGLFTVRDAVGNVFIKKPGNIGGKPIALQAHVDMVCVKGPESPHDFLRDPIRLITEDGWLRADGTTLGADDGIGCAYIMAVLADKNLEHPDLECLFTVDEERGMTGARAFDLSLITADRLINLDEEIDGSLTCGCAGGVSSEIFIPAETGETGEYTLIVSGLLGGHSGVEAHKGVPSAIKVLAERLGGCKVMSFTGGEKENAFAVGACAAIGGFGSEKILRVIDELPQGVLSWGATGQPEVSNNIGIINTLKDGYEIRCLSRGAVSLEPLKAQLKQTAEKFGGSIKFLNEYPAWEYRDFSPLRDALLKIRPGSKINVIHAGLECGLFYAARPDLDIVAIGPQVENAHTPRERLNLKSAETTYKLLRDYLSSAG